MWDIIVWSVGSLLVGAALGTGANMVVVRRARQHERAKNADLRQQLSTNQREYDKAISDLKSKYEEQFGGFRAEVESLHFQIKNLNEHGDAEYARLTKKRTDELEALQAEHVTAKAKIEEDLKCRATAHETMLKEQHQMHLQEIDIEWSKKAAELNDEIERLKNINRERSEALDSQMHEQAKKHRAENDEAYRQGMEKGMKAFRVQVRPVLYETADEGYIWHSYLYQSGYQYQLFLHDVPIFDPHVVIDQQRQMSKVDKEAVQALLDAAVSVAKAIVEAKGGEKGHIYFDENPRRERRIKGNT